MKLVYAYFKDIQNGILENINLNICGRFKFSLIDKEIIIEDNPSYISEYFGNEKTPSIEITSIVGRNGAGKTTILNNIMNIFYLGGIPLNSKCILIFENGNSYHFYYEKSLLDKLPQNEEIEIQEFKYDFDPTIYLKKEDLEKKNIQPIYLPRDASSVYYSNSFTSSSIMNFSNEYNLNDTFTDISLAKLFENHYNELDVDTGFIYNSRINDQFGERKINRFNIDSFYLLERINYLKIQLTDEFEILINELNHQKPEAFNLEIKKTHAMSYDFSAGILVSMTDKEHIIYHILSSPLSKLQRSLLLNAIGRYQYFVENFLKAFKRDTINLNAMIMSQISKEDRKDVLNISREYITHLNRYLLRFTSTIPNLIFNENDLAVNSLNSICSNVLELSRYIIQNNVFSKFDKSDSEKSHYFSEFYTMENTFENIKCIEKLIDHFLQLPTKDITVCISDDYKLSSGEEALYTFLSRLLSAKENSHFGDNIYVFFDEVDIYLHPEWQRCFINILCKWMNSIFNTCKSIQILITTNSPFILSDFPSYNVVALEKNNSGRHVKEIAQTLGANIHELLTDSIFMDFSIGEVVRLRLEKLVDALQSNDLFDSKQCEEAELFIENIGEPIIKKKLQELYFKKINISNQNHELDDLIQLKSMILELEGDAKDKAIEIFNSKLENLRIRG